MLYVIRVRINIIIINIGLSRSRNSGWAHMTYGGCTHAVIQERATIIRKWYMYI